MPDLPAPQHSAALNRMLGFPVDDPEPEPAPSSRTWASRAEHAAYLAELRRKAAARSRARRTAA